MPGPSHLSIGRRVIAQLLIASIGALFCFIAGMFLLGEDEDQ